LVIINNELAKLGIVFLVLLGVLFLGLNYYYDHRFAELKAIAKQISDEKKSLTKKPKIVRLNGKYVILRNSEVEPHR